MNADRIAKVYRWIEYAVFGRELERCRTDHLTATKDARRVLILGEGDGRFLAALLRVNPTAFVDVVDASGEMLRLAARRIGGNERVRFWQDTENLRGPYDLIVTNFFLDCLTETEAAECIHRCAGALIPGGHWIVGEFQEHPGPPGWRTVHAWIWIRTMYLFFKLTTGLETRTIPNYERHLFIAGLHEKSRKTRRFGLMVSQLWIKRSDGS